MIHIFQEKRSVVLRILRRLGASSRPAKCLSAFEKDELNDRRLQRLEARLYGLIDSLVTPPMFSVTGWMDNRVKTPAKSLQAGAFSFGKPSPPGYFKSLSFSCNLFLGQIPSQFPGHIEAVLWPPLPPPSAGDDVMTKNTNCDLMSWKISFQLVKDYCPTCAGVNVKASTLITQAERR